MYADVLLGLQWGDEGKGKVVDYLAPNYDIIARFQGGPNAGHTLVINGVKTVLHTIPSGIFHENVINVIGNGVVIDPVTLTKELNNLKELGLDPKKNLKVSKKAHLILPTHKILDAASEAAKGKEKIGSTLKGIGPTYMDKTGRNGLRVGDLFTDDFTAAYTKLKEKHIRLLSMYDYEFDLTELESTWMDAIEVLKGLECIDTEYYINAEMAAGKKVLAEGAQGSMLDIEFGTYPFVTSSNTITAGACIGLGIAPQKIREVIGITKSYCTRVGSGAFPTELEGDTGEFIRKKGGEFGATTGRPRRTGWIDMPQLRYTCMLNGVTQIAMTKVDILTDFDSIKACHAYNIDGRESSELPFDIQKSDIQPLYTDLEGWKETAGVSSYDAFPEPLQKYIAWTEEYLKVPISMVSYGPEREALATKAVLT